MGLESDAAARQVGSTTGTGFVDTYGLAFGRDVEPSVVRAPGLCLMTGATTTALLLLHSLQRSCWGGRRIGRTDAVQFGPHSCP